MAYYLGQTFGCHRKQDCFLESRSLGWGEIALAIFVLRCVICDLPCCDHQTLNPDTWHPQTADHGMEHGMWNDKYQYLVWNFHSVVALYHMDGRSHVISLVSLRASIIKLKEYTTLNYRAITKQCFIFIFEPSANVHVADLVVHPWQNLTAKNRI